MYPPPKKTRFDRCLNSETTLFKAELTKTLLLYRQFSVLRADIKNK